MISLNIILLSSLISFRIVINCGLPPTSGSSDWPIETVILKSMTSPRVFDKEFPLAGMLQTNLRHNSLAYGQIPRNGLTLGSCPQQWGSHCYIILKIFLIAGLYSVIW